MRDSTEARRCDECGAEHYNFDIHCDDCAPMFDEGLCYELFIAALRKAAEVGKIPLESCGCNADWIGETYHLSGGAPNQTPGDLYITDNEDGSWSVVRRFYVDYQHAPAQDGATYAGDGYNDEVRDVLTVELGGRGADGIAHEATRIIAASVPRYVVAQCHDGTDVAVYAASVDDYSDEVMTLEDAETLAYYAARERGCRYLVFTEITALLAPSVDDHSDDDPDPCQCGDYFCPDQSPSEIIGECAECGLHFTEGEASSATRCLDCGKAAESALRDLADRLAEGGMLAGADLFLGECSSSRDPRIEAACNALRPALELLYSLTERD